MPPDLKTLAAAAHGAHRSDMRMEATVLGLLVLLPAFWLWLALGDDWPPAGVALLLTAAGVVAAVPLFLVGVKFDASQRCLLLNAGLLRLLLPPLLPTDVPWDRDGAISGAGDAVGLTAHQRMAARGSRRLLPWRLLPGLWIGRLGGDVCAWRRTPEGWILVGRRRRRPTSPKTPSRRSRR